MGDLDVEALREGFTFAYFERGDPERDERRYYYLAWQESALGEWCLVGHATPSRERSTSARIRTHITLPKDTQ